MKRQESERRPGVACGVIAPFAVLVAAMLVPGYTLLLNG